MKRVHLVYPHGDRMALPDLLGKNLGLRLEKRYSVSYYDWDRFRKIRPGFDDVLLGHACPIPFTTFRRSCKQGGWKRVLLLSPHCHGDDHQPAYNQHVIKHCHLYLAITGAYWFSHLRDSGFRHWEPKMIHVDLAIDRQCYPGIKRAFNGPGKRKFLYVGRNAWYKNLAYLSRIAQGAPDTHFGWIGVAKGIPGIKALGYQDFGTTEGKALVADYDFMITVGKADGNPTTILEAMSWGLIPVCTPQSGYVGHEGIINIPLGDPQGAIAILTKLQGLPEEELIRMQESNWNEIDRYFTWDRLASQVIDAIESTENPPCGRVSLLRRSELLLSEVTNPFWIDLLNVRKLRRRLKKYFGN